jgi:hypothetical protein
MEERIIETERKTEERRIAAEKAAEDARMAEVAREREWHILMEEAERRFVEADRIAVLRNQVASWEEAEAIRRYCDAVDSAFPNRPGAAEWAAWARAYADRLDPLDVETTIPPPPQLTPDALQPFLPDGWSAIGADAPDPRGSRLRTPAAIWDRS